MVRKSIGESLIVRLRNKTEVEGKLLAYDEHLNMMIENVVVRREGEAHPKALMYLRGDTVLLLARKK